MQYFGPGDAVYVLGVGRGKVLHRIPPKTQPSKTKMIEDGCSPSQVEKVFSLLRNNCSLSQYLIQTEGDVVIKTVCTVMDLKKVKVEVVERAVPVRPLPKAVKPEKGKVAAAKIVQQPKKGSASAVQMTEPPDDEIKVFAVGDRVSWRSQAGGNWSEKSGQIIAIVPKGKTLKQIFALKRINVFDFKANGKLRTNISREDVSYLVSVPDSIRKPSLYWPLVRDLQHKE